MVVSYSISTSNHNSSRASLNTARLCLILFLHQTTTLCCFTFVHRQLCLILFLHQTTTQGIQIWNFSLLCLILFLHQTTTRSRQLRTRRRCVLFYFYIKPQHIEETLDKIFVVSYSISTSNHNCPGQREYSYSVVSYSISTSNHNPRSIIIFSQTVVSYSISTSNHNALNNITYT